MEHLAGLIDAMRQAIADGRHEELQRAAHNLKGAGGGYGYPLPARRARRWRTPRRLGTSRRRARPWMRWPRWPKRLNKDTPLRISRKRPHHEDLDYDDDLDALEIAKTRLAKESLEIVARKGGRPVWKPHGARRLI